MHECMHEPSNRKARKYQNRLLQWKKYCGETENDWDSKLKSMMTLVEQDWICTVCKKNFKDRLPHLKDHVESHLGGVSHQCPDCGKMYGSTSSFRLHYGNPKRCKNASPLVGPKGGVVRKGGKNSTEGINNCRQGLNDSLKNQKDSIEGPKNSLIDPKNNLEGLAYGEQGSDG